MPFFLYPARVCVRAWVQHSRPSQSKECLWVCLLRLKALTWPDILWKRRMRMRSRSRPLPDRHHSLTTLVIGCSEKEAHGMAYVVTAQEDSIVYLGVKVYMEDHGDN